MKELEGLYMTQQEMLGEIETAIINKMASATGLTFDQMLSEIKRIPELKKFYKKLRSDVIKGMAA